MDAYAQSVNVRREADLVIEPPYPTVSSPPKEPLSPRIAVSPLSSPVGRASRVFVTHTDIADALQLVEEPTEVEEWLKKLDAMEPYQVMLQDAANQQPVVSPPREKERRDDGDEVDVLEGLRQLREKSEPSEVSHSTNGRSRAAKGCASACEGAVLKVWR